MTAVRHMSILLLASLTSSAIVPEALHGSEAESINLIRQLSPFDCKSVGNFTHPTKCSAYAACDTNLRAFEMLCPYCSDRKKCPEGRFHFDLKKGTCVHPSETTCQARDECDIGCKQKGFCECFDTCLPDPTSSTGGRWKGGVYCDIGLYWNPDNGAHLYGGSCDFWVNLTEDTKEKYRQDHNCPTPPLKCYWEADVKCHNQFYYLPENSKSSKNLQHLKCPKSPDGIQLYWNQERLSCGFNCVHDPCVTC